MPFFEGCFPSPLAPSYASAAAVDVLGAEAVGAASASGKRHSSKGKGGRGGGGGNGGGGGGSSGGGGGSGGGGSGGSGSRSGGLGGGGGGNDGSGGSGSGGSGGVRTGAQRGGSGGGQRQRQQRRSEAPSPQQLCEWLFQRGASGGSVSCPYVIRTGDCAGQTCGKPHTQHCCFSRLDDAWRAEFGDQVERPHWAELLRSGVAIFDLDYDAILSAMYALSASAEGDCYRCVPLDPDASRCFFRDSSTLTPLPAHVPARLADPSGGPVIARSSTVLPCPAVPSGSLPGLHLPSFSTNLVSTAGHQDAMVSTTTPGVQRVSMSTCTWTGRHLAKFTRRPGSSLYTLATEPPQVAASAQVSVSGQVALPCSCRLLSHQTLLWHHHLGHPSLPRLHGMHSRLLVSGLPRSLPPLPPSPAPPCLPFVEGRQRAAPHSSLFPPTTAPLQTLHMDVWGPARVSGQGRERYFLLVVDDYTRYTTVFPLRSKGQVVDVLIPWIRVVCLQLCERFRQDLPVLRLHCDRGGQFSSDLLRDFCRGGGIQQSSTIPDSPKKSGIAERRIGLVMEVARTSMIHAAAPHFLSPFAVRYAAHQLNLLPRVSLPETSPTLRWMGKVGDALVFRFYHPTSSSVFPSQDVMFDKLVPFYHPLPGTVPVEVARDSGAARGAASDCAELGGAEPGGAESEGTGSGGADPGGAEPGLSPRPETLSPQQLREWLVRRARLWSGATGAGGTGDAGAGGAHTRGTGAALTGGAGGARVGDPTEPGAAGAGGSGARGTGVGGAGARGTGAGGAGARGAGAGGAGAVKPGAGGDGGTVRPQPYFVPLLQQVLGVSPAVLQSVVSLGHVLPQVFALVVAFLVRVLLFPAHTLWRFVRPLIHCVSSLPAGPYPESHCARAASPTVSRLLAIVVTDPSFESTAASALVAELLDFVAACCLDYATALNAESESVSPPSVGGECALGTDVLEDRQEEFECLTAAVPRFASMLLAPEGDPDAPDIPSPRSYPEATTGPYSSHWQAAMDAEMASWKSTGTYVDEVTPPRVNIVDGMWIFRVKRPPGSPPALKARYVPRGFSQRQGVDYFQTFSPTLKMTTLRVLLHVAAQRDYETTLAALGFTPTADTSLPPFYVLVYVDDLVFATADIEALTLVLQRFGFQFSSPHPTPLSTGHTLSAPPSDESVEPSGPYPELVGCLMYLMTCTLLDLAYPLSLLARYVAPGRHRKVHWDAVKRVLRYLCSTSGMGLMLGGRGPVVLTGHADVSW
ncbi:unnamed protein product, partial [Closterium sp. NIES-53]